MSVAATFDFDVSEHYRATRAVTRNSAARYYTWGFVAFALLLLAWNILPALGEAGRGRAP